jgi:hypothetical protein
MKIIKNCCQCAKCGDIIESTHVHDFVTCTCGAVSVDGGHHYIRRLGNKEDIIPMDIIENEEKENSEKNFTHNISLDHIEQAVNNRLTELEDAYARALEQKTPFTLRKAIVEAQELRIKELETALEDIAGYATIETPQEVIDIINKALKWK